MSVAALMLVKDEADIVGHTVAHLLEHVDQVIVRDNMSTDGTRELLEQLAAGDPRVEFGDDLEVGYWQSRKTTALAMHARELGHDWVLPCDADEMWVCDGRPIRDWLLGIAPDVGIAVASLLNYMPTAVDVSPDAIPSPFARIGWRQSQPAPLGKVCVRTWRGLEIHAGNHGASFAGTVPTCGGLRINHYPWRSTEQFGRKVRNGARAYAATDLPEGTGAHWRMWGDPDAPDLEERAADHFRRHFWAPFPPNAPGSSDPRGLVYDPAQ